MKSYTDLEQSKKLEKILAIESADMLHCLSFDGDLLATVPKQYSGSFRHQPELTIPCWSLTALLNILPSSTLDSSYDHYYRVYCKEKFTEWYDNPIDACVEMIDRLHEQMIYDFNNS